MSGQGVWKEGSGDKTATPVTAVTARCWEDKEGVEMRRAGDSSAHYGVYED